MVSRSATTLLAAALLTIQVLTVPAMAENKLGYTLLPATQADSLSRGGGVLGMDVGRAQQITNDGMTFELLKVNSVRQGSAGEQAGFKEGDQIIAVDGRVFPSVKAFAAYVGSKEAGDKISVDYMPVGGGPQQAQRVGVTLGTGRRVVGQGTVSPAETGLSTGTKVAIGVGAAALFGCYEMGCFSRLKRAVAPNSTTLKTTQMPQH
jgi:membrane-associated protease RseP (regulator of RpoE activity)